MIVLKKPLQIGEVYEGKFYTRQVEDVWEKEVKVMTIDTIKNQRRPGGIRPINGFISIYGFKVWMLNNGLAKKKLAKKKMKPEQLRLW